MKTRLQKLFSLVVEARRTIQRSGCTFFSKNPFAASILTFFKLVQLNLPRFLSLYLLLQFEVLLIQFQHIALKLQITRAKLINVLLQLVYYRQRSWHIWRFLLQCLGNGLKKRYTFSRGINDP